MFRCPRRPIERQEFKPEADHFQAHHQVIQDMIAVMAYPRYNNPLQAQMAVHSGVLNLSMAIFDTKCTLPILTGHTQIIPLEPQKFRTFFAV